MNNKITSNIALIVVLAIIAVLVIFPILPNLPSNSSERELIKALISAPNIDLASIFMKDNLNLTDNLYIYFTRLILNFFPNANLVLILRLPGAIIITFLTVCLFNFDGSSEKLNASFLASLLFLTCGLTIEFTFHATPLIFPAAAFIFALMSLYHWLHHLNRRYFSLLVGSCAISTILIGVIAPFILLLIGCVFIASSKRYSVKSYLAVISSLALGVIIAFLAIYMLLGDKNATMQIFRIEPQFISIFESNSAIVFLQYLIFAIFPWSVPLIISCYSFARNPHTTWDEFIKLTLLERFGLVIFILSIPTLFFVTPISVVFVITTMFFNMPLIGKYLLTQFNHHPYVWRITGMICAIIVSSAAIIFIFLKSIACIIIYNYAFSITPGWSFWQIFVLIWIFGGLYSLWRNKRDIGSNNRYLYNIITIYLAAIILYTGYIDGHLSVAYIA